MKQKQRNRLEPILVALPLREIRLRILRLFSGGEKARLAFAIISYQKPNILLMDEPTNHLDMEMRHALTVAIQTFKGAILLISHDRHLT